MPKPPGIPGHPFLKRLAKDLESTVEAKALADAIAGKELPEYRRVSQALQRCGYRGAEFSDKMADFERYRVECRALPGSAHGRERQRPRYVPRHEPKTHIQAALRTILNTRFLMAPTDEITLDGDREGAQPLSIMKLGNFCRISNRERGLLEGNEPKHTLENKKNRQALAGLLDRLHATYAESREAKRALAHDMWTLRHKGREPAKGRDL